MTMSYFDKAFRRTVAFDFFTKGWGRPDLLLQLIENMKNVRSQPGYLRENANYRPVMIENKTVYKQMIEMEGSFVSPIEDILTNSICSKNRIARFQMIIPKKWKSDHRPVCFHFAGTGDHSYYRRRVMLANQLLNDGIASIIIMNPFYGTRMPTDQKGSGLNYLSDLFVMGGALILECNILLSWCQKQGFGPFAFHGVSMGGYMATICATTVPIPISLIPCLSWTSASVVFLEGVLSNSVDWRTLTKQYLEDSVYSKVIRPLIQPSIRAMYKIKEKNTKLPQDLPPTSTMPQFVHSADYNPSASAISPHQVVQGQQLRRPKLLAPPPAADAPFYSLDKMPFNDLSKLWAYMKSHNKLHLLVESHIWDSALSALRSVPLPSTSILPESFWSVVGGGTGADAPDPEVREFLRELLDFFTHIGNFPPVADCRLITSVTAGRDAYIPRDGVVPLDVIYPDADIRLLPQSGHVSSYVRNALWSQDFRDAVCDTFNRQMILQYGLEAPIFGKSVKSSV